MKVPPTRLRRARSRRRVPRTCGSRDRWRPRRAVGPLLRGTADRSVPAHDGGDTEAFGLTQSYSQRSPWAKSPVQDDVHPVHGAGRERLALVPATSAKLAVAGVDVLGAKRLQPDVSEARHEVADDDAPYLSRRRRRSVRRRGPVPSPREACTRSPPRSSDVDSRRGRRTRRALAQRLGVCSLSAQSPTSVSRSRDRFRRTPSVPSWFLACASNLAWPPPRDRSPEACCEPKLW
jgi:hypothetical protein